MEREKIFRAITGCCINDAAANEATDRVLALFSVVGQSEQLCQMCKCKKVEKEQLCNSCWGDVNA